ncbi:hypothetical protein JCM16303_001886 [Sporobolomyces ruberrimus]
MDLPTPPTSSSNAPTYPLSKAIKSRQFTTIEYPAPISRASASLESALSTLSPPLSKLSDSSTTDTPIEIDLEPKNPYFHKVPASSLNVNNIVVKLTKRTRKVPKRDEQGNVIETGQYKIEPIGVEHRVHRFRGMADFQYIPNLTEPDPTIKLVEGIRNLDIKSIREFRMPPPSEDFSSSSSSSSFIPPPIFSRHLVPQNFDFRPAGGTIRQVLPPLDGSTTSSRTRLVNSTRYKVRSLQSIYFVDTSKGVPTGPDEVYLKELNRREMNEVEKKMRGLLEGEEGGGRGRPVWSRTAMLNQLNKDQVKYVMNNKSVWPMIGYTFADGPFKDLIIRFGYDPRTDPEARFYQSFMLRNINNVRTKALPGSKSASQAASASVRHNYNAQNEEGGTTSSEKKSHIFDGIQVYSKVGNFQLCDISDPLSKALIDSTEGVLAFCSSDANEGWFAFDYFDQIKQVVRRKFMSLLQGVKVEDRDCDDILGWELSKKSRKGEKSERGGKGRERRDRTAKVSERKEQESFQNERNDGSESEGSSRGDSQGESGEGSGSEGGGRGSGSGEESGSEVGTRTHARPKHVRAPWELPRKKRNRPKVAETEEEMLARLQRKARRSTTTALAESSASRDRRASTGMGDDDAEGSMDGDDE